MALRALSTKLLVGGSGGAAVNHMKLFLPMTSCVRFKSGKKDKKDKGKVGCEFKFNPQKPPCTADASCQRTVREPECYDGSKLKPKCSKKKKFIFKEAPTPNKTAWSTEPPFQTCGEEFPKFSEECCPECPYVVRLDVVHYHPKGLDRDFEVTWIDCGGEMVPQQKCCSDQYEMEYDYRPKLCRPAGKTIAQSCRDEEEECKRFDQTPCCRTGRNPPSCRRERKLTDCKKMCVPVPSYSECCLPPPYDMPTRGPQCYCLDRVPMCLIYRELSRKGKQK